MLFFDKLEMIQFVTFVNIVISVTLPPIIKRDSGVTDSVDSRRADTSLSSVWTFDTESLPQGSSACLMLLTMDNHTIVVKDFTESYAIKQAINEANILSSIQNNYDEFPVPHLLDFISDGFGDKIYMEYIHGIDMFRIIEGIDITDFSTQQDGIYYICRLIVSMAKNVYQIINKLHDINIYHLDIKLENIIKTRNDNAPYYLIDFGNGINLKNVTKTNRFYSSIIQGPYAKVLRDIISNEDFTQKNIKMLKNADVAGLVLTVFRMISYLLPTNNIVVSMTHAASVDDWQQFQELYLQFKTDSTTQYIYHQIMQHCYFDTFVMENLIPLDMMMESP